MNDYVRYMKRFVVNLLMFLVIGLQVQAYPVSVDEVFNVLVIHSYHIGHYWEDFVLEGFVEEAKTYQDKAINVKAEYLDFRNCIDETYIEGFIEFLELKYPKGSIDAIYTIDDEAFSVITPRITEQDSVFYQVPLFFNGVDASILLTEEESHYIAGAFQRDVTLECFNLMLQLDDSINRIIIITEDSGFGENLIAKAGNIVEEHYDHEIELIVIKEDYIQNVQEQLQQVQQSITAAGINAAVLMGGEFQDLVSKGFLEPNQTVKLIQEEVKWPIFTNDPTYLEADMLGGCVEARKSGA